MNSYGQYCPISRSAEILGDRWTILIVRDLLTGSTRFNELIRGNPGLSRALLSRRLRQLQLAGIVDQADDGTYVMTEAGQDLMPIVFGLAEWGARWAFGEPEPAELDPDLLMWWLHRELDTSELPGERFTVYVTFTDHPKRYWVVAEPPSAASLCTADPGFEVDVSLRTDRATLYRVYLGREAFSAARRDGSIDVSGPTASVRAFTRSFQPSPVASIVAAAAGR